MSAPRIAPALLAVLGFLSAVGPFATDMYLASLPTIADDLSASAASVQLTLTAFLFGMAAGQFVFGPLSDRYGRRPVVLVALALFAVSSIALVFTPSVGLLITLRAAQGATGAAGVVIARAVAADLTTGAEAVRALSIMTTISSLSILIAPLAGSMVLTVAGWRGVLACLAVIAVLMFVLAFVALPESLPPEDRLAGGFRPVLRSASSLLRDPAFVSNALTHMLGFAMLMAYVSSSTFVVQSVLDLGPVAYGASFACGALAMIAATMVNARLAASVGPERMRAVGIGLALIGGATLLLLVVTGSLTVYWFVACAMLISAAAGLILADSTALALARATHARGTGSAILGCGQFLFGAAVSPVVGLWGEHTALPMAVCVSTSAVLALVTASIAQRFGGRSGSGRMKA